MMHKLKLSTSIACVIALSACASVRTEFSSQVVGESTAPITKVFVIADIQERVFNQDRYGGFESGLREGFAACGVTTEVYKYNQMEVDFDKNTEAKISSFQPSSKMIVKFESANLWQNQGQISGDAFFFIGISDVESKKPIWKSKLKYFLTDTVYDNHRGSGRNIGLNVVDQIKRDGLLSNCKEIKR